MHLPPPASKRWTQGCVEISARILFANCFSFRSFDRLTDTWPSFFCCAVRWLRNTLVRWPAWFWLTSAPHTSDFITQNQSWRHWQVSSSITWGNLFSVSDKLWITARARFSSFHHRAEPSRARLRRQEVTKFCWLFGDVKLICYANWIQRFSSLRRMRSVIPSHSSAAVMGTIQGKAANRFVFSSSTFERKTGLTCFRCRKLTCSARTESRSSHLPKWFKIFAKRSVPTKALMQIARSAEALLKKRKFRPTLFEFAGVLSPLPDVSHGSGEWGARPANC